MSEKFTLRQLAEKCGHLAKRTDAEDSPFDAQHRVADFVHGWSQHEYHYQQDAVMLTESDYCAALESASALHVPHEPAIAEPPSREELDRRIKEQAEAIKKAQAERKQAEDAVKKDEAQ